MKWLTPPWSASTAAKTITIPPLPDDAQWQAFDNARKAMLPGFRNAHAGERYQTKRRLLQPA